jgi:Leucine-rich repeat (LRR) protein
MNIFTSCQKKTKYDKEVKVEYTPARTALDLPITNPERVYKLHLDDGRVPSLHEEMMKMRNLRELILYNIQVEDWKTSEKVINSFHKLKNLILVKNQLNSLPFDPDRLACLKSLNLSYNEDFNLSRNIDKLCELDKLEKLVASGIKMKTLPKKFLALKNLKNLYIGDHENFDYRQGFSLLSKHTSLEYLSVIYANLNPLPNSLKNLKGLKKFGLYNCHIDLIELLEITRDWNKLEFLKLGSLEIKLLPKSIKDHKNLKTIWLFGNRRLNHKKVFKQLSYLPDLEELNISGTIRQEQHKRFVMPEELAGLKNLKRLDMVTSHNLVFDSLFDVLVRLPKLEHLNISDCSSEGYIVQFPDVLHKMKNLKELDMSYLGPNPFDKVTSMPPNIEKIKYTNAYFDEKYKIQKVIFTATSLKSLNLNSCELKKLPAEIGNLKNLVNLDLGNNQLKDLPESITKLKKLRYLNLMGTHIAESKEKRKEIEQMLPNTLIFFGEYEAYEPI